MCQHVYLILLITSAINVDSNEQLNVFYRSFIEGARQTIILIKTKTLIFVLTRANI